MRLEFATDRKALHYDFISGATDPKLGRFLTPDTIIPDWYNPQAYNRYAYVYNNPLIYTDPSGHFAQFAIGAAIGLAIELTVQITQNKKIDYIALAVSTAAGATGIGVGGLAAKAATLMGKSAVKAAAAKVTTSVIGSGAVGAAGAKTYNEFSPPGKHKDIWEEAKTNALLGGLSTAGSDVVQSAGRHLKSALREKATMAEKLLSNTISPTRPDRITELSNSAANATGFSISNAKNFHDIAEGLSQESYSFEEIRDGDVIRL